MGVTIRPRALALVGCLVALAPVHASAQQPPPCPEKAPASTTPPTKEAVDEARTRYERGTQLYAEGDYKLALIEFQRAYELAPSYKVLYNIGQVNLQVGGYANALRAFEKYLLDGGSEIPPKRRAEVDKEIAGLRVRTAHIAIVANVEGAEISIDGNPVATTPLCEPLLVDAGQHAIAAKKEGHIQASKTLTLAGSDSVQIEFDLPERPRPVEPVAPVRDRDPTPALTVPVEPKTSYLWVGWTATGVLTAGAVATGIAALSFSQDLKSQKDQLTTQEALQDQQTKARTAAILTDVLGGAALLVGAATLYFTLTSSDDTPAKPAPKRSGAAGTWYMGIGPTSARLERTF